MMFALEVFNKGLLYLGVILGLDNAYKIAYTEHSKTLAIVIYALIFLSLIVDFIKFWNAVKEY
jgi:hypothetical protein